MKSVDKFRSINAGSALINYTLQTSYLRVRKLYCVSMVLILNRRSNESKWYRNVFLFNARNIATSLFRSANTTSATYSFMSIAIICLPDIDTKSGTTPRNNHGIDPMLYEDYRARESKVDDAN